MLAVRGYNGGNSSTTRTTFSSNATFSSTRFFSPEHLAVAQLREICHAHWQLLALQLAGRGQLVITVVLIVRVPNDNNANVGVVRA